MKSKILKLSILLAGFLILLTTSCKKDLKTTDVNIQTVPVAQNPGDLKLARLFTSFKQKGSQKLKDGEKMSIDSAIWFLQGTANFTYGKASQQTAKVVIDSSFITLMLTDSSITLTEVWNKYSEMIDSIRARYQQIVGDQKQLLSVQVQRHQLTGTELVCKVTSIISAGGIMPDFCEFNNVDYWTWWNVTGQGGICGGPHAGGGNGADAAMLINQKIMNCLSIPVGSYYWSDQVSIDLEPDSYPNPNWGGVDKNYYQFRMFWNHNAYSNFHGCLSPEECNFYLEGTKWVAMTAQSQGGARPDDKGFISISIYGDAIFDIPNLGNSEYLHHGPAYYGTLHWNPNPPLPM